jgi:hypothetical protein
MNDSDRARWCCPNRECEWSTVKIFGEAEEDPPRCICGGLMERAEPLPFMTYLDFLRGDPPMESGSGVNEE